MKIRSAINTCYTQLFCLFAASQCLAQSTPTEFAQMSLQELFKQNIYDVNKQYEPLSNWAFTYKYKTAEFEGYIDGSESLSFDDVLWNGPSETRTNKNFPILPTKITQQAHILAMRYQFNPRWQWNISIPYIKQATDHESIVSAYETFTIETAGIGDTSISASYHLDADKWQLSFGLSLPTGSINEKGDTPRAPGNQQLPYTMQLGSGTYDFPIELSYQNSSNPNFNINLSANIRTGKNNRNYRLGNNYNLSSRYKVELSPTIEVFSRLAFKYSESIHGQDDSLLLDTPNPYPASITNPRLYGGKKIKFGLGALWEFAEGCQLNIEFSKPIYQHINGPQPKEKWRSSFYISKSI